jgi:hypothetical protein
LKAPNQKASNCNPKKNPGKTTTTISREQIDLQNPQNSNLNTISREQIDLQNLQKKNLKI